MTNPFIVLIEIRDELQMTNHLLNQLLQVFNVGGPHRE